MNIRPRKNCLDDMVDQRSSLDIKSNIAVCDIHSANVLELLLCELTHIADRHPAGRAATELNLDRALPAGHQFRRDKRHKRARIVQ